ncbi:MAG: hypothetical protein L0922_07460, partial [Candidatus Mariimomonas ferrooxydans]
MSLVQYYKGIVKCSAPHKRKRRYFYCPPLSTLPQPSLTNRAPHYLNYHSQTVLHTTSTITH